MLPLTPPAQALLQALAPPTARRLPLCTGPALEGLLDGIAQQVQALTLHDAVAVGLLARATDTLGDLPVRAAAGSGLSNGTLILHLSPNASHRVLIWLAEPAEPPGPAIWLDGHRLAAAVQATPPGHWADNHIYAIEVATDTQPAQHSGQQSHTAASFDLLLWDASTGQMRVESAPPQEAWPAPWACMHPDGRLAIHADQREGATSPARLLSLPL